MKRMTEQLVDSRRASMGTIALWVVAFLGVVAVLLFSVSLLVGLLFSLGLSDTPPDGLLGWAKMLLVLLAFVGLPALAAYGVARIARRRFTGVALACVVIWTVPLASLVCWVLLWVTG